MRVVNGITLLSLVSCTLVVTLWVRSYRGCDALVRPTNPGDRLCLTSEFGVLVLEVEGPVPGDVRKGWEYFQSPLPRRWPVASGPLAFAAYSGRVTHFVRLPPSTLHGVAIPHWAPAMVFAVLPAGWLRRHRRNRLAVRRSAAGLCGRCGYDLRASPLRCPECGRDAGRDAAAAHARRSGPPTKPRLPA